MTPPGPSPDPLPSRHHALPWLPLVFLIVGLLVTVLATRQSAGFIERERQAEVDTQITRLRNDLVLHVQRHIDVLRTYQAEFAVNPASPQAVQERIARVLELQQRLPGIELVGNVLATSGLQPIYSVRYVYPEALAKTQASPAASDAVRQEAVRRARDTGNVAATPPVRPAPKPDGDHVVMVYLPLYRGGITPLTLEARQRTFVGAAFLGLRPDRLMATVLEQNLMPEANIRLRFEGYVDAPAIDAAPALLYDFRQSPLHDTDRHGVQHLTVAGTRWSLEMALPPSELASHRWLHWAVAAVGVLLSTLSAYALHNLQRSRRLSQQLASNDRRRRQQMQAALHLRHRAIEASANPIVICSATKRGYPVEYVNSAFERMTGFRAEEVIGQSLRIMHGSDTQQEGLQHLQELLRERREGQTTLRNYRKDGQLYWTRVHIAPVRDDTGTVTHFVASKYDITETLRYQETLEFQAWHDPLTHLPNRHLLRRQLEQTIEKSNAESVPFWVVFLDLDNFKLVNDTMGHTQGDLVLQQIARRLQDALHAHDIVARRGGDEFVFILFDHAPPRNALATVNRIMAAVSRPLKLQSHRFFPTCSMGIAVHPLDGNDSELLIKRADMAMYHAKASGRDNYQFYSEALEAQATRRVQLEGDLHAALANGEFELHYQPQIRLSDGMVTGAEALVRWRHPQRGLVSPGEFIPLAEETGLIVPLGEWILRSACEQTRAWMKFGLPQFRVAVNLSARQFKDQQLPGLIRQLLDEHELAPEQLELELTETMVMSNVNQANVILQTLKSLGIMLSLDDFGTGYSSLAQLKRFPLDIIKIDRSFVSSITTDRTDATIVQTIVKLAHNLGMLALAEGVESAEQEAVLREHGCDVIQGYLISRPLPADQFEEWVHMRLLHIVT